MNSKSSIRRVSYSLLVAAAATSGAGAEDLHFEASLASNGGSCAPSVRNSGSLVENNDRTVLSSIPAGGDAGQIALLTTGSFEASVMVPTVWTASPANVPTTNFAIEATLTNPLTLLGINLLNLADISLSLGENVLTVDLSATATTGTFPDGNYRATVVVTCEPTGRLLPLF